MNIQEIFNSRITSTITTDNSKMVNGIPPCQNVMFPILCSQQQNPYQYQPLIHVPTRTNAFTLGEVGASVDMLRAQMTELSNRMDAMESKFSEFKNSVSNDIYLLKNMFSQHSTELLHTRDAVECARAYTKDTNKLIEKQNNCIDKLEDAFYEHKILFTSSRQEKPAQNISLGMIRRRLSKVEDFTNEFYQQFENFKNLKDIILNLSDHVNECDQDISMIISKNNENFESQFKSSHYQNGDNKVLPPYPYPYPYNAIVDLDTYFSEYNDDNKDDDNKDYKNEEDLDVDVDVYLDYFEKL